MSETKKPAAVPAKLIDLKERNGPLQHMSHDSRVACPQCGWAVSRAALPYCVSFPKIERAECEAHFSMKALYFRSYAKHLKVNLPPLNDPDTGLQRLVARLNDLALQSQHLADALKDNPSYSGELDVIWEKLRCSEMSAKEKIKAYAKFDLELNDFPSNQDVPLEHWCLTQFIETLERCVWRDAKDNRKSLLPAGSIAPLEIAAAGSAIHRKGLWAAAAKIGKKRKDVASLAFPQLDVHVAVGRLKHWLAYEDFLRPGKTRRRGNYPDGSANDIAIRAALLERSVTK